MSSFNDYCDMVEYNGKRLAVYLKKSIDNVEYYICENYLVLKKVGYRYAEVKDNKVLQIIKSLIVYKK